MRWLKPLAHHFDNESLWSTERGSVARAVAIGLFVGFMIPLAQFVFAIAAAAALRAHIAIAAAATLVTNPLTIPPIYWAAYKIGRVMLGEAPDDPGALQIEARAADHLEKLGWIEGLWNSMLAAGPPLLLGLVTLAVAGALLGFSLSWWLWRPGRDTAKSDPA